MNHDSSVARTEEHGKSSRHPAPFEQEISMSDRPRPWPNFAKEARDRSADEAAHIVNSLTVLIDGGRDLQ